MCVCRGGGRAVVVLAVMESDLQPHTGCNEANTHVLRCVCVCVCVCEGVEMGGVQEAQVLMPGGVGGVGLCWRLHVFVQITERWRDDRRDGERRDGERKGRASIVFGQRSAPITLQNKSPPDVFFYNPTVIMNYCRF